MMKNKIVAFISILLAMTFLASCGNVSDIQLPDLPVAESAQEDKQEAEAQVTEETEEPELSDVIDYTVIVSENYFETVFEAPDDSGKTILTFSYATPSVNIVDNPEATNRINDYLDSVDELYYSGNEKYSGVNYYHELATDNYSLVIEAENEINAECYSIRKYVCTRCDSSVISFVYTTYDYFGVSNESYFSEGFSFNTSDGSILAFDDVSADRDALLDLCAELLSDNDIVKGNSLENLSAGNGWYFSSEGLAFLAPDAAVNEENSTCYISYEKLDDVILPELIPAIPAEAAAPSVSIVSSGSFADNSLCIIDRLQLDDSDESSYLVIEGTACNLSISSVDYNDSESIFQITDTLWSCNSLSDCAVQLEIVPPSGLPVIMVSFSDCFGNSFQYYAVEGEENGTTVLSSDEIVPLG